MRVVHRPTRDEVAAERKRRYLELWPIERQLEAHAEAAAGRPGKQSRMMEDFARIREVLPFFEEDGK